jgi:putative tryptophan/tyrosine transport system substrate-binding protein
VRGRTQQQALPVVGFLHSGIPDAYEDQVLSVRQGLKEIGYVENENVIITYRWANTKVDQLPMMALDLVHLRVAVIIAAGPQAALAAKAATSTIPIVVAFGSDPVSYGLVNSLSRPGGNVTGATFFTTELIRKRIELLCGVVPLATRQIVQQVSMSVAFSKARTLRSCRSSSRPSLRLRST